MSIREIQAIDVHAHYGPYEKPEAKALTRLMSAEAEKVAERARIANTELTFVSPTPALLPLRDNDPATWNRRVEEDIRSLDTLRYWVVVDPTTEETYEQARRMLTSERCIGIKVHPEAHGYPISRYGRDIFTFARRCNAVVLSHSGQENSKPQDFVIFADEFSDLTIIMAHLGNSWDEDPSHQVRAVQKARHDNLFIDTSSSSSVFSGLLEWAVAEIGSDKLLYGTDSPLYFAPMQRARIDYAEIADADKRKILRENALRLFRQESSDSR